jgi:hypothetical protein
MDVESQLMDVFGEGAEHYTPLFRAFKERGVCSPRSGTSNAAGETTDYKIFAGI